MTDSTERAWVVCCEPRVVLFGYATRDEIKKPHPTLKRARMLVYWSSDIGGVMGSASVGPSESCRVSPAAPEHSIRTTVEAYMLCTNEAVAKWEAQPWA